MVEFARYFVEAGVPAQEAQRQAAGLDGWDGLRAALDRRDHPVPDRRRARLSIGAPPVETSWKSAIRRRFLAARADGEPSGVAPDWPRVVERRRKTALVFALAMTALLEMLSDETLRAQHIGGGARAAYLGIYGIMSFFMISTFWKLVMGSWHALRGPRGNPWHPSHTARDPAPETRVAIIYPVYHEDVSRVCAGMAATWESILRAVPAHARHYDMFLLSDSRATSHWVAERAAIQKLRRDHPDGRFHYRWRPSNHNAKLGNVADFCRRWGSTYHYVLVMDADSLMTGDAIHAILRMMEGNHRIGILQTNPTPILRESLFGRMQQFSGRLYGTVFSYSLQAMYMGHANYIGHNAIIRMAPFVEHCVLPDLPGRTPWGGKPLSHDIVEAAMMARAGYEVWFLPEIAGSYEEIPANILGFLIRERRWMQGNLQHIRLLFMEGLRSIHREGFVNGLMGYLSAPLWAAFLVVSAYSMTEFMTRGMLALGSIATIEVPTILMFAASMVFLFLPRLLALVVNIRTGRCAGYGGKDKLLWSMLLETVFSLFFSPIIMIYVTRFVWLWLKRRSISWGTQQRDDAALPWAVCIRHFGWVSALGVVLWWLLLQRVRQVPEQQVALLSIASGDWISPASMLVWFFPILGGFTASVFIARFSSRSFPSLRRSSLFLIPEEAVVPREISDLRRWEARFRLEIPDAADEPATLAWALCDAGFYVRHRRELRRRPKISSRLLPKIHAGQRLTGRELSHALRERDCFDALHERAATP